MAVTATEPSHDATRPRGILPVAAPQRNVTLVEGSSFCVSAQNGDIDPRGAEGLFVRDTRIISCWQLRIDGALVEPLSVIPQDPYSCVFIGRAAPRAPHTESTIIVKRRRYVGQGMREDLMLENFGTETAAIDIELQVDADFADLFVVKEGRAASLPRVGYKNVGNSLVFWLDGPGQQRGVRIEAPEAMAAARALSFRVLIAPKTQWSTSIEVVPNAAGQDLETMYPAGQPVEQSRPAQRMRNWHDDIPKIQVTNTVLAQALRTSERDLGALQIHDPNHPDDDVVAAGAPWFMALFGRDSLLSSWMMLPFAPRLALGTLRTLARLQGTEVDDRTEEQPGRILHEMRLGADLSLALGGQSIYYGSIDSTPLFVMLVGRALRWGIDLDELAQFREPVLRALNWIVTYGDRDRDGFVEYQRTSDRGLVNQGWKDSFDGVNDARGVIARPPIALAEVQAYCYAAMLSGAHLLHAWGEEAEAQKWQERAHELQQRFDQAFWMPEHGTYAIGLDCDNRRIDAVTSNAGHCLWAGIVPDDKAPLVAARLLQPDMWTGFGIRTLSSDSAAYNPASYHNGSVWPHDTVLAAAGMASYGLRDQALTILSGLVDALEAFGGRLPELFCGFPREEMPIPVVYPTSCSPQAWAAATPYELLRLAIDLDIDVTRDRWQVAATPDVIGTVMIKDLPVGQRTVDIVAEPNHAIIDGSALPTTKTGAYPTSGS